MKRSAVLLIAITILLAAPAAADLDGDGLAEIGVLGVEREGKARGPWFQAYSGAGSRLVNLFLGDQFDSFRVLTADLLGEGRDEIVALGFDEGGAGARIQLLDGNGRRVDVLDVQEDQEVDRAALFTLDVEGDGTLEIGIGTVTEGGAVRLLLARVVDGSLQEVASHVLANDLFDEVWLAGDVDGETGDELLIGHNGEAGNRPAFLLVEPGSGAILADRSVGRAAFRDPTWLLSDVIADRPGAEVVAGIRKRNGLGFLRVFDAAGKRHMSFKATPRRASDHHWLEATPAAADAPGIVVAYRASNGQPAYRLWDLSEARPTLTAANEVLDSDAGVEQWLAADFDGRAANGQELVAVYRTAERAIRFARFDLVGGEAQAGGALLDANHFDPRARAIRATSVDRYDLLVVAPRVDERPSLVLYDTDGAGTRLLDLNVLGPDVH